MALAPLDRKIALMRHGVTMTSIALRLDVSPNHVAKVVRGQRYSKTVRAAVAEAIGLPVEEVFGPQVTAAVEAA